MITRSMDAGASRAATQLLRQSGVVVLRRNLERGALETLLISTRRGEWLLPKGHLEPGLAPHASAAKEAYEEAGVIGSVLNVDVGSYDYRKNDAIARVTLFPMVAHHLLSKWPERWRERCWLGFDDAADRVSNHGLADLLASLPYRLPFLRSTMLAELLLDSDRATLALSGADHGRGAHCA